MTDDCEVPETAAGSPMNREKRGENGVRVTYTIAAESPMLMLRRSGVQLLKRWVQIP